MSAPRWNFGYAVRVTQTNGHSFLRNGYTEAEARRVVDSESGRANVATVTLLNNGVEVAA